MSGPTTRRRTQKQVRIHPVPGGACKIVTVCAQEHISNVSLKLHTGVSETSRHHTDNSHHHSLRILKDIAVALSGGLGEEKQDLTRKASSGLKYPVHCRNFSFPREQQAAIYDGEEETRNISRPRCSHL